MNHESLNAIINPEVPTSPEAKRALLGQCLSAVALRLEVVGVTPKHVTIEGLKTIELAQKQAALAVSLAGDNPLNNVY